MPESQEPYLKADIFDLIPVQGNDGVRAGVDGLFNQEIIQVILDSITSNFIRELQPDRVDWLLQEHAHYDKLSFQTVAELLDILGLDIHVKCTPGKDTIINFSEEDYTDPLLKTKFRD